MRKHETPWGTDAVCARQECLHKLKFHDASGCREHGCTCTTFMNLTVRGDAIPEKKGDTTP